MLIIIISYYRYTASVPPFHLYDNLRCNRHLISASYPPSPGPGCNAHLPLELRLPSTPVPASSLPSGRAQLPPHTPLPVFKVCLQGCVWCQHWGLLCLTPPALSGWCSELSLTSREEPVAGPTRTFLLPFSPDGSESSSESLHTTRSIKSQGIVLT